MQNVPTYQERTFISRTFHWYFSRSETLKVISSKSGTYLSPTKKRDRREKSGTVPPKCGTLVTLGKEKGRNGGGCWRWEAGDGGWSWWCMAGGSNRMSHYFFLFFIFSLLSCNYVQNILSTFYRPEKNYCFQPCL